MNVKLLEEVRDQILAHSRSFDMASFFNNPRPELCDTTACIAGWAMTLALKFKMPSDYRKTKDSEVHLDRFASYAEQAGATSLELTEMQARRLFYLSYWPRDFIVEYNRYAMRNQLRNRAQVAARRIDYFIKTKGNE